MAAILRERGREGGASRLIVCVDKTALEREGDHLPADLGHLDGRRVLLDERPLHDLFDAAEHAARDDLGVARPHHAQLPPGVEPADDHRLDAAVELGELAIEVDVDPHRLAQQDARQLAVVEQRLQHPSTVAFI